MGGGLARGVQLLTTSPSAHLIITSIGGDDAIKEVYEQLFAGQEVGVAAAVTVAKWR